MNSRCTHCSASGCRSGCADCAAPYCDADCQRRDWAAHKSTCNIAGRTKQTRRRGSRRIRKLAPADKQQKFVWLGTVISDNDREAVQEFFLSDFGAHVTYLGTIVTLPGDGGPGGRHDAVFSIEDADITRFASARFKLGSNAPRWWEDYLANNRAVVSAEDIERFDAM